MVVMSERAGSLEEARVLCRRAIEDGSALERFRCVIEAQGGDPRVVDDPARLPQARSRVELCAPRSGFVQSLVARPVGHATMLLGAGRARVDSRIDPAVGLILHKKTGDAVERGEPLCTFLINDPAAQEEALAMVGEAYAIGDDPVEEPPLIVERF
jgi:thymidine phosphorylase